MFALRQAASGCSSRCGSSSGWATAFPGWARTARRSTPPPARSSSGVASEAKVKVMSGSNARVSLPVRNPYTGEVDYEITPPTAGELADICSSLRAAQVTWGAAPPSHRIEVMLRWADELDAAYGPLSA